MNILIIEDEREIARAIVDFFNTEKYVTECAHDFASAMEKLGLYEYDCVVVDITLPDGNGFDIIRYIKEQGLDYGIIIVSALNSIDDKIWGLDIGADDYLAKPFSLPELNARVKSVIRRRRFEGRNDYVFHEFCINTDAHKLFVHGKEVVLTRKEYDLFLFFVMNRERVLTKETIVEHLWGDMMGISADSLDFVYTHIRNLRKKLLDADAKDYIKTVYAVGYKFTEY